MTVTQTKREKERKRITKGNTNRLRKWKKERKKVRKKKRVRVKVREKMKTLEERKTEDINLSEICTQRRYKIEK